MLVRRFSAVPVHKLGQVGHHILLVQHFDFTFEQSGHHMQIVLHALLLQLGLEFTQHVPTFRVDLWPNSYLIILTFFLFVVVRCRSLYISFVSRFRFRLEDSLLVLAITQLYFDCLLFLWGAGCQRFYFIKLF